MKKIITLVLALALVLTSVVAIAESVEAPAAPKGTPNIKSFATMKTKYNEGDGVITITLSKPVDRLLVNWAEKGAEPEELAVGEDLIATALTWGHKYMPGTTQSQNKSVKKTEGLTTITYSVDYDLINPSERIYRDDVTTTTVKGEGSGKKSYGTQIIAPKWTLMDTNEDNLEEQIALYKALFPLDNEDDYEIVLPQVIKNGPFTDIIPGYIKGSSFRPISTVRAYPSDHAYFTVQGDWAVYYNREGKIVGIELFDGQF